MERESPKCVTTNGFLILFQGGSSEKPNYDTNITNQDVQSNYTSIDIRLHKGVYLFIHKYSNLLI